MLQRFKPGSFYSPLGCVYLLQSLEALNLNRISGLNFWLYNLEALEGWP